MGSLRYYRPNKNGTGTALEIVVFPTENKWEPFCVMMTMAKQIGVATEDSTNASFSWTEGAIKVKLGSLDIGSLLSVINGIQPKKSLFHQTPLPKGGSKAIDFNRNENGSIYVKVSAMDIDKKSLGSLQIILSIEEIEILRVLLTRAVELTFGW